VWGTVWGTGPCRYCVLRNNVLSLFETPDGTTTSNALLEDDTGHAGGSGILSTVSRSIARRSTAPHASATQLWSAEGKAAARNSRTTTRQLDGTCSRARAPGGPVGCCFLPPTARVHRVHGSLCLVCVC
jgi:hypothetical protein